MAIKNDTKGKSKGIFGGDFVYWGLDFDHFTCSMDYSTFNQFLYWSWEFDFLKNLQKNPPLQRIFF